MEKRIKLKFDFLADNSYNYYNDYLKYNDNFYN